MKSNNLGHSVPYAMVNVNLKSLCSLLKAIKLSITSCIVLFCVSSLAFSFFEFFLVLFYVLIAFLFINLSFPKTV